MLEVQVRKSFLPERIYILNVILKEFLGLCYQLCVCEEGEYPYIIRWNDKRLLFTEDFFPINEKVSYLNEKYLPQKITAYQDVVVLYGKPHIEWTEKIVKCSIDMFGSAFFMLTRWEEYINKTMDAHGRFPMQVSTAFQYGFSQRPVVNEYVELLWKILTHLKIPQDRKRWHFQLLPTHDVDLPKLWWNGSDKIRSLLGSLLRRKSIHEFATLSKYLLQRKDPFDTFEYLMQLSEKNGRKAHFFFMSGGTSKYDNHYVIEHPFIKKLLHCIDERGHIIGFHPSYNAYNDTRLFGEELARLQAVSPQAIATGRQHFLRFSVPKTWQIWAEHQMEWSSTMGYAEQIGFRCGVCYPFTVFDVLQRKPLDLKERPLLVMDVSLQQYQQLSMEDSLREIAFITEAVKQYSGELVLLWHNSSFNLPHWKSYSAVYENMISA